MIIFIGLIFSEWENAAAFSKILVHLIWRNESCRILVLLILLWLYFKKLKSYNLWKRHFWFDKFYYLECRSIFPFLSIFIWWHWINWNKFLIILIGLIFSD